MNHIHRLFAYENPDAKGDFIVFKNWDILLDDPDKLAKIVFSLYPKATEVRICEVEECKLSKLLSSKVLESMIFDSISQNSENSKFIFDFQPSIRTAFFAQPVYRVKKSCWIQKYTKKSSRFGRFKRLFWKYFA